MKFIQTSEINSRIRADLPSFVAEAEAAYTNQLNAIADQIAANAQAKPILLLSGPSGAGKTTSALRLEARLSTLGLHALTISMDNYFLSVPPELSDSLDYESPERLDIPLLNEHLRILSEGGSVEVPTFDFKTQQRAAGYPLKRHQNEVILLEGIHALNPAVTGSSSDYASCMYVSVRTRIQSQDGTVLHPSGIRLMRRLMRDRMFRGRTPEETLSMFENVSRGETMYIMPYKHRACYEVDTFHPYEASVYREILLPELMQLYGKKSSFTNCELISEILAELSSVSESLVPPASLIREFIGGSTLSYEK